TGVVAAPAARPGVGLGPRGRRAGGGRARAQAPPGAGRRRRRAHRRRHGARCRLQVRGGPAAVRWWHRLDVRLFASYAAVTAVAAAAALVTVRLLVPPLFDRRMGGRLPGPMGGRPGMHDALTSALDRGLVTALLVGLVAAAVAAALVTRWVLRPIARVRTATRRLAAGHYDERVAPPREPDLAGLAEDVNALARSLDDTERRRAQLVGDVAHEMRTPLTTIRGYAEAMVD